MEIFILENNIAKPSPHILLISPFKEIWEQDETDNKEQAIRDFTFIEFMCSPKSSNVFFGYSEEERPNKIILALFPDYEKSNLVESAIDKYKEFLEEASYSYSFLLAARKGAEKMKSYFRNVDLTERTNSGGAVNKITELATGLAKTEEIIRNLQNLSKRVFDELKQTKTRANKEINPFER